MEKLLPRVKKVQVEDPYRLVLTFTTNEVRLYDMEPLLKQHPQDPLKDKKLFRKAYVSFGTVEWNEDISLCPDSLYLDSQPVVKKL